MFINKILYVILIKYIEQFKSVVNKIINMFMNKLSNYLN
jgi:hypothetical protein